MEDDLTSPDVIFKVVIVGDSGVGKTCLLNRYMHDIFTDTAPTVGIGYGAKSLEINQTVVKLQIWDTAGQETFRSIARTFYKGTHGVVLTYSLTKSSSFNNLQSWIKDVKEGTEEGTPIVLVGNMKDLVDRREVSVEQAAGLCETAALSSHFEVSAASGEGINAVLLTQVFSKLGTLILERSLLKKPARRRRPDQPGVVLSGKVRETAIAQKKKKGCCS